MKRISLFCIAFLISYTSVFANQLLHVIKQFLPEDPVIIDCGCYDCGDSMVMARFWPQGQVYAFEPVPSIYVKSKNAELYFSNIKVFPYALGDFDGKSAFYISEEINKPGIASASSSILPPKEHLEKAPGIHFPKKIDVDVLKLDTWALQEGIDHVDFLWLDMQGYELNMLKSSQIAQTAKVIWTEVISCEAYQGQYKINEMIDWMSDHDFVFAGSDFDLKDKSQWFGNLLFIKKSLLQR